MSNEQTYRATYNTVAVTEEAQVAGATFTVDQLNYLQNMKASIATEALQLIMNLEPEHNHRLRAAMLNGQVGILQHLLDTHFAITSTKSQSQG